MIIREEFAKLLLDSFGKLSISNCFVSFVRILRLREVARVTARIALEFAPEFVYVYRLDFVKCYLSLLEDGDEPSDDDNDDDDTDDEDEEPTKDEEEEEHLTLADPSVVPVVDPVLSDGDIEAFETDESAPIPRSPDRVPFFDTSP
ncbi:hypothetical protein Tco_0998441 [Tanacetum coccineum]